MKVLIGLVALVVSVSAAAFTLPSMPSAVKNAYVVGQIGQPSGNVPGFAKTIPAVAGAVGYKFGNIALEGGYGSIGRVEFPNGTGINGRGYGVAALYSFAPYGKIIPFVKVGENRITNTINGVATNEWTPSAGLGFSIPVSANVTFRATFERYQKEARNATSIGLVYGF